MKKLIAFSLALSLLLVLCLQVPPSLAQDNTPPSPESFNGNPYASLAIGTPHETIGSNLEAGAAHALYGAGASGLSADDSQLWYQGSGGLPDSAEESDTFAKALAFGDFNNDGFYDLAVGVPGEDIGEPPVNYAGAVHVLYGTANGLSAADNQLWYQGNNGLLETAESNDEFGCALASGDFDADGYDDLSVGVCGETVGNPEVSQAGMVQVLYGSGLGLTSAGDQVWRQGANGIQETAEAQDHFGSALAAGDFDDDGYDDLAVGIPGKDISSATNAGAVHIIQGSGSGLTANFDQFINQNGSGFEDEAEAYDYFGTALAAGDLNSDGHADLCVGIPYENVGSPAVYSAGAVHIFYGADSIGIGAEGDWLLYQDAAGVAGVSEANDEFGRSLALGDFDGNGRTDLAVGIPGEGVGNPVLSYAGAIQVFYSLPDGSNAIWYQGYNGLAETAEAGDQFGTSVAAGDFNGDRKDDLAVGTPTEDAEGMAPLTDAGVVQVIYGSSSGLTADGNQLWHQDSPDIGGAGEDHDQFGKTLAAVPTAQNQNTIFLPIVVK